MSSSSPSPVSTRVAPSPSRLRAWLSQQPGPPLFGPRQNSLITLLTTSEKYDIILSMKYDSLRKKGRNEAIARMRFEHPELSLKEIGKEFGVTDKRVWAILDRAKASQFVSNKSLEGGQEREIIRGRIAGERKRPDLVIEP